VITAESAREKPGLADRVADQLRRLIERGEFPRDCRLPTEFALCRRFGVSRPVVRTALAMLRDQGIVQSLKGSGSVVIRGPDPGGLKFPLLRTVADIEKFFEFRVTLEREAARLAAERHTPETLGAIEAALLESEHAVENEPAELAGDTNFRLHRAIALATDNPFHVATMEAMPNLVGIGPIEVRHNGLLEPRARQDVILREHRKIFEAIRVRDAALAGNEMAAHISAARRWVYQRHPSQLALADA
jgi:DNA-binding FadR family transcriptional regulator